MAWTCGTCTLSNDASASSCAACESPKNLLEENRQVGEHGNVENVDDVQVRLVSLPPGENLEIEGYGAVHGNSRNVAAAWPINDGDTHAELSCCSENAAERIPVAELATKSRAFEDLLRKVLEIAKTQQVGSKWIGASFTGKDFVKEFISRGWSADEAQALQILQEELLDVDVVNTVPYSRHPQAKNGDTLYRLGRRYGCEHSKVPPARISFICQACDLQALVPVPQDPSTFRTTDGEKAKVSWTCKDCTFENSVEIEAALRAAGIHVPDEADQVSNGALASLWEAGKYGLGQLHQYIRPDTVESGTSEKRVRSALQRAVLLHEDEQEPASWFDPVPLHELLAVDRSNRVRTGEADESLLSIYAPLAMKKLRAHFGIDEDFFCESLFEHELHARENTGGRSDSLFFFSADKHFVVKTVPKAEMLVLRRLLPDYFTHMLENPDSFLPRFLCLFKVCPWPGKPPVHCLVMTNVVDSPLDVEKVFDLKGSTANRFVSLEKQRESMEKKGSLPTLKDLNWKSPIELRNETTRAALLAQIMADTQLLARYKLMDYSVLIGVHTHPPGEDDEGHFPIRRTRWQTYHGGLPTPTGVYFIGIIDILQEYDMYKQAERFVKTSILSPLSGYLQRGRQNGGEVQVPCPYCKFQYNKVSVDGPSEKVIQVSCIGCGASFDYAEEGITTSDTNISSIQPVDYRRRLLEFVEAKVFC